MGHANIDSLFNFLCWGIVLGLILDPKSSLFIFFLSISINQNKWFSRRSRFSFLVISTSEMCYCIVCVICPSLFDFFSYCIVYLVPIERSVIHSIFIVWQIFIQLFGCQLCRHRPMCVPVILILSYYYLYIFCCCMLLTWMLWFYSQIQYLHFLRCWILYSIGHYFSKSL